MHWVDRRGDPVVGPNLDLAGGELHGFVTWLGGDPATRRLLAVRLSPDDLEGLQVAALDRASLKQTSGSLLRRILNGRVITQRSREWNGERNDGPLIVAAPMIEHVRVRGSGGFAISGYALFTEGLDALLLQSDCEEFLGLPIDGPRDWYAGDDGRSQAEDRVFRGAPLRLGPPDQPDGPFDGVNGDAEVARVFASAEYGGIATRIEELLHQAGANELRSRLLAQTVAAPLRPAQRVFTKGAGTLLLQSLDPGLGRYLGLMTLLHDGPSEATPFGWLAAGVFALDPSRKLPDGRTLGEVLGAPHSINERLIERFCGFFPILTEIVKRARDLGLMVRVMLAPAAAPLPPDRLGPPQVSPGQSQWIIGAQAPSLFFRQQFRLADLPLSTLCSVARRQAAAWLPMHRSIATDLGERRVPILLGRNADGEGILSDASVPAVETPMRYRLRIGDLFGRYGAATEQDISPPARPNPPRPAIQARLELIAPDRASAAAVSPGKLIVSAPTPEPKELGAGAQSLSLAFRTLRRTVSIATGWRRFDNR